ncbi:MAG: hypothetical protein MUF54_15475, partial [Polyangiaceae bacterium]|nr:hypothetical protein [Polyangiaceae bacterium]
MVLRIRRIGGRRDVLAVVPVGELGGPRCGRKRQRRHNNVCIVVPEWNMGRSLSTNDCEARWAFDAERNPYRRVNADENGFTA